MAKSENDDIDEQVLMQWTRVVEAITHAQSRVAQEVEKSGLPAQWFAVLRLLLHAEERRLPMTKLARELSMTSGGFTKLADRMGRDGLIDRRNSSGDRRVVYAAITDEGRKRVAEAEPFFRTAMQTHVLDLVSPTALKNMSSALTPIVERVASEAEAEADGTGDAAGDAGSEVAARGRTAGSPDRRSRPR